MSRGQGVFNISGGSSGVRGVFQLRQSEVSEAASIKGSDKSNTIIPELTREEELAIKKSRFAPVGQLDGTPSLDIASSGNIRVSRGRGEHTDINTAHLQENAEHKTTNPLRNMAKSTRAFLTRITAEADFNRPSTSTADVLYDNRPSTSTADVDIEITMRKQWYETDGPTTFNPSLEDKSKKKVKKYFFLPKFIIMCVVVGIVIAGIVGLTIAVERHNKNKDEERGNVLPNPITVECQNKSFRLGDPLNFTCTFDTSLVMRTDLLNANVVHVIPKDRAFAGASHDYRVSNFTSGKKRIFSFYGNNLTAKCSSAGIYDVIFINANGAEIHTAHTANVNFSIEASSIVTTFNQRQLKGSDCLKSEFDATCELQDDCNSYHVTMYRLRAGNEENMNTYMTCERSYTDVGGHVIKCKATIPDNLVGNFVGLGCKMSTTLQNNRQIVQREAFSLPRCGIKQSCHTYIPPNPRPFNCSDKSRDVLRLNEAECGFPVVRSCFMPGRKIFTGIFKDISNNLTCSSTQTVQVVPVCRLSWCRDYNYIFKNEVPGTAICPSSYEESYVRPPEDFLTTPYTTPYRVTV